MAVTYKRYAAGTRAKHNGQRFEQLIENSCKVYARKGIAVISKTPEPFRVEKHIGGGKFIGHYEKTAQPDFKGVIKGGQTVIFEAKHTDDTQIKQTAVTEAQADSFRTHEVMGARCFVLVSMGTTNTTYYRIPWSVWDNMQEHFGHRHIKAAEAAEYQIHIRNGILQFL